MERRTAVVFFLAIAMTGCGGGGGSSSGGPSNTPSPNPNPTPIVVTQTVVESTIGGTRSHSDPRLGDICSDCHKSGNPYPVFTIAGSVFKSSDLTKAQPNVQIEFYADANGSGVPVEVIEVDANGNFYTTAELNLTGLYPAIRSATEKRMMPIVFAGGQCNGCHKGSPQIVINVN